MYCGEHGCGPGHVAFHRVHAVGRLEIKTASVEGDALADQCQMELRPARAVAQANQPWRSGRSTAHRHQAAVPPATQRRIIQNVDRDLAAAYQVAYLLGKGLWIEQVRWDVHPFPGSNHCLDDRLGRTTRWARPSPRLYGSR